MTTLGTLQALDTLTKDRAVFYRGQAIDSALRDREALSPAALRLEADALRDAADQIESLADKKGARSAG